jgi:Trypsin-like peptidase domain
MQFDPLEAVGLVMPAGPNPSPSAFLGTCFRFRHERVALTAAHVVPQTEDLVLVFPRSGRTQIVQNVARHPTADIAVLVTEAQSTDSEDGYPQTAFWDQVGNWGLGEEFMTYGYPSEGPTTEPDATHPRLFVGYYQRFFQATMPGNYRYLAGEMSVPALAGMSGSPLFRPGAPQMVTGMVTTSVESYTITDSVEEVTHDAERLRIEARKVISFGTALMLSDTTEWLHAVVPPRRGLDWIP